MESDAALPLSREKKSSVISCQNTRGQRGTHSGLMQPNCMILIRHAVLPRHVSLKINGAITPNLLLVNGLVIKGCSCF